MAYVCICATVTLEIILFVNESSCELISTAYFLTASVPFWKNQLTSGCTPIEMRPIQLALIQEIFSSFPTYAFCKVLVECIGKTLRFCFPLSNSLYSCWKSQLMYSSLSKLPSVFFSMSAPREGARSPRGMWVAKQWKSKVFVYLEISPSATIYSFGINIAHPHPVFLHLHNRIPSASPEGPKPTDPRSRCAPLPMGHPLLFFIPFLHRLFLWGVKINSQSVEEWATRPIRPVSLTDH